MLLVQSSILPVLCLTGGCRRAPTAGPRPGWGSCPGWGVPSRCWAGGGAWAERTAAEQLFCQGGLRFGAGAHRPARGHVILLLSVTSSRCWSERIRWRKRICRRLLGEGVIVGKTSLIVRGKPPLLIFEQIKLR